MLDRDALIRRFARGDAWFDTSPLYQVLSRTVAADDDLLDLAAECRPGQQPANMLMAATHLLVLKDPGLPFARFFASVRGDDAESPEGAGAEFAAFCAEHCDELSRILRERLVQTNAPGRGVAVRLAMHEIGRRVEGPVTFLEFGPSAGIQLRFERWAVHTGGLRFGPPDAPLTLRPQWRSNQPPPDLDDIPPVRDRLGVDLHPVDATDPEQRLWLQALVWPEHRDRFAELATALDAVAADPPTILRGDAIELLPRLQLPDDIPWSCSTPWSACTFPRTAGPPSTRRSPGWAGGGACCTSRSNWLEAAPLLAFRDSQGAARDLARVEGHGRGYSRCHDRGRRPPATSLRSAEVHVHDVQPDKAVPGVVERLGHRPDDREPEGVVERDRRRIRLGDRVELHRPEPRRARP